MASRSCSTDAAMEETESFALIMMESLSSSAPRSGEVDDDVEEFAPVEKRRCRGARSMLAVWMRSEGRQVRRSMEGGCSGVGVGELEPSMYLHRQVRDNTTDSLDVETAEV